MERDELTLAVRFAKRNSTSLMTVDVVFALMKNLRTNVLLMLAWLAFGSSVGSSEARFSPNITGINIANDQVMLTWTNGRPPYQLRPRSALDLPWVNLGAPTGDNFAAIPITGTQGFFRVVSDFTARYQ